MKDGDVWVLAYASGEAQRFTLGSTLDADWMPDSRRLLLREVSGLNTSLSWLDTETGVRRTFYVGPFVMLNPSVSPDGQRIAFAGGVGTWELVEVGIADGRVRTLPSGGHQSWWPAWAPKGSHFGFAMLEDRPTIREAADDQRSAPRVLA